jgi:hypothetical protein
MLQLRRDPGKVAPNFEWTNPMRPIAAIAFAALLAGCSLFSSTTSWTKPGVTPEKAQADLDTCKQVAWEQQGADERIDQDTSATMSDSANRRTCPASAPASASDPSSMIACASLAMRPRISP